MTEDEHGVDQEIRLGLPGVRLEGVLHLGAGEAGLVVFAHGSGSSRNSPRNRRVAHSLHQRGLGTLLFDLLTEEEEQSDAFTRHLRFNIPFLAGRLIGATRWILEEGTVRDVSIGYFGSSTGAAAALMAAAELRDTVRAVVSRGGRPDLAGDALRRVTAPTQLIVGGNDAPVLTLNEEALEMLSCHKVLRVIPGASHLFEEPGALETVADLAAEWFSSHLGPRKRGS
jgi:putative phosphoribosyl transferase